MLILFTSSLFEHLLEDDEDLLFLTKEPSSIFGTGSPSVSESLKPELFVVYRGSVAARIKDQKCKTRRGSSRPPVKRKLALGSSTSRATRSKTSSSKDDVSYLIVSDDDECLPDILELKDATACNLKISSITPPSWKNHLNNHINVELLDLHDRCYARQAVDMKRVREEECEELRAKCEVAMTEFEKNPTVVALREKKSTVSTKVKEHKVSLDIMMLESQKWVGYQQSSLNLELKEVEEVKQDMREVLSKVVPYAVIELVHSDDIADPSAPIEALLLKKPSSLQRPAPSRTQVPLPSSQKATSSSVLVSNPMSPPVDVFAMKPQSSQLQ
ncbi:hypothetical protein Tco_0660125 [Tanacetum coccineum]